MNLRARAFTLVELLVVIGIIALLIAILLPALSRAKAQADSVKCAASMRVIGNALRMYALDSKGWYPPSQLRPAGGTQLVYHIDGFDFNGNAPAYWINFLAKYMTKSKVGNVTTSLLHETADGRKSIFWACPAWQGYISSTQFGGFARVQTGYGYTLWPTFTPDHPAPGGSFPPAAETTFLYLWTPALSNRGSDQGRFHREKVFQKNGAGRIIVADSRFWTIESNIMPVNGVFPPQSALQNVQTYTPNVSGQTMIDVYRHGKYPPPHPTIAGAVAQQGGRVSYNCLWGDGHVSTESSQRAAYEGIRQRFPR